MNHAGTWLLARSMPGAGGWLPAGNLMDRSAGAERPVSLAGC